MLIRKKILVIIGTRPEAIKMGPLIHEFKKDSNHFELKTCITGQHRELLDNILSFFSIIIDFDLSIMEHKQTLHDISAKILTGVKEVLKNFDPDYIFVHGDTTTTLMSSIAGFYSGITVCHVEAGLRTYNKKSPFPEELNRQLVSKIADLHFTPTKYSENNLLKENINPESIKTTGNTVIDAVHFCLSKLKNENNNYEINSILNILKPNKDLIVVTAHRRENHGNGIINICKALIEIAQKTNVQIIYPVHLNPEIQNPVNKILKGHENIHLISPLSYPAFVWLMARSKLIISDSGGIQEEASSIGKPMIVLRDITERLEAEKMGNLVLVGTDTKLIVNETLDILNNRERYNKMSVPNNTFGDGKASKNIVSFIRDLVIKR